MNDFVAVKWDQYEKHCKRDEKWMDDELLE
jgi:hypothetical protein